jgi:hypothetical protein
LMRKGIRALAKASMTAFRSVTTHLAKIRTVSSSRAADASPLHPPEGAATRTVRQSADLHPAPIPLAARGTRTKFAAAYGRCSADCWWHSDSA